MRSFRILFIILPIFQCSQINSDKPNNSISQQISIRQLPNCQRIDITNIIKNKQNGIKINIKLWDKGEPRFSSLKKVYLASNFNSQIKIHQSSLENIQDKSNKNKEDKQNNIMEGTNVFEVDLNQEIIKVGQLQLTMYVKEVNKEMNDPLVICLHYLQSQLIHPIRSANYYTFLSNPMKFSSISNYFLLPTFTHSLRLHLTIKQGYPFMVPYICRQYNLISCLLDMQMKISQVNERMKLSKYHMLSNLVLDQEEIVEIDYCQKCYLVIYIQRKIGKCQVQIWFGTNKQMSIKNSNNTLSKPNIGELKEGRFNNLSCQVKEYKYSTSSNSQVTYYANLPLSNLYYSCTHDKFTHKLDLGSKNSALILIPQSKNFGSSVDCSFYFYQRTIPSSQISKEVLLSQIYQSLYYTNMQLRSLSIYKTYPTVLTRSHPGLFHFIVNEPTIYLNIRKCVDAPVRIKYYFLPDFDAIRTRIPQQAEYAKQDEDWVYKTQVRAINNLVSLKINKPQNPFATKYLIVQIIPDTYSFLEVKFTKETQSQQSKTVSARLINLTKGQYKEDGHEVEYKLFFIVEAVDTSKKDISNAIKIIQSQTPDSFQLDILCPNIILYQYQMQTEKQIPTHKQKQRTLVQVSQIEAGIFQVRILGRSQSSYLAISLKLGQNISYTAIELKSKIGLLNKYKILLIACFLCIVLIFVGVAKLIHTRPPIKK